jgi:FkbM family methyltransferase
MKILITTLLSLFYKILFIVTIYLPLRIRDLFVNFWAILKGNDRAIDMITRLFKNCWLLGILPDGNLLFYPLDDIKLLSIISEIYIRKIYDVELREKFVTICDIGAHIGLFTLKMSKQYPNSKIIAIEPNPMNFNFLIKNIFINGLEGRVCLFNVAIGGKKGKIILLLSKLSRGDSSIRKWHNAGSGGYLVVNMLPLDEILLSENFCNLIKIDVEGAEMEVLRGLEKQYVKVCRLIMEIHTPVVNVSEIYKWLYGHGFIVTKTKKLYEDCLLLEARRLCA